MCLKNDTFYRRARAHITMQRREFQANLEETSEFTCHPSEDLVAQWLREVVQDQR